MPPPRGAPADCHHSLPPSVSERLRELGAAEVQPQDPWSSLIPKSLRFPQRLTPGPPGTALSETGRIPALRSLAKSGA